MIPSKLIRGSIFQTTWSVRMASTLTQTIAPDMVISFEINPGTLREHSEKNGVSKRGFSPHKRWR